jgi:hypothetical protein
MLIVGAECPPDGIERQKEFCLRKQKKVANYLVG